MVAHTPAKPIVSGLIGSLWGLKLKIPPIWQKIGPDYPKSDH